MDKSWMSKPRSTKEYETGVNQFLDMAFDNVCLSGKIMCPCKHCRNGKWVNREVAKEHLIVDGFMKGYSNWIAHGEKSSSNRVDVEHQNEPNMEYKDMYLHIADKYHALNEKLENLTAIVHERAQFAGQTDSQSAPLPSSNNLYPSESMTHPRRIRVNSYVVLKSLGNINEIVASGYINQMGSVRVQGEELGSEWCEITIQSVMKRDVRLLKPYDHIQTIGDSLGAPVAWPLSLVALDED